jgi:hypothetical protein
MFKAFCLTAALFAVFAVPPESRAQQSKTGPPAPVPPQMLAARKVFISNAGGASFGTVFAEIVFDGGPDRIYNQFYAAMKGWGRYEIVAAPADADLVLKVSWLLTDTGLKLPVLGRLEVEVIDPKTTITLWSFDEYVRGAVLLSNRDKNFDRAMNTIVDRMKKLVESPTSAAASPTQ